ncbi:MAG: phytanoyl-CoA dioxygenase family protein [Planctomycetota bacterium]|nr:phytanoyl-CoA dioxygenase family protein [Planctomycetota bacterium]
MTSTAAQPRTTSVDLALFHKQGYVVLDVLSPAELARHRAAGDAVMQLDRYASKLQFHYIPLITPGAPVTNDPTLLETVDHPILIAAVEKILGGGPLVLDNAAILCAEPGAIYIQGWHRDVLQVPQEHITDEMFSPRWVHNNVQLNMALADDAAFHTVPGSHARPDTPGERAAFGNSRHLSPDDASMPGSVTLHLKPGQAVLYNNNLIHRGYAEFTTPRRTLHIGYHSVHRPPTWHFYNFDDRVLPREHIASLPPSARRWMEARLQRRIAWPDIEPSWRSGFVR